MSQICGTKAQIIETRLEIGYKIMTEVSSLLGQQLPSLAHIYDKAASMLKAFWILVCFNLLFLVFRFVLKYKALSKQPTVTYSRDLL